MAKKHSIVVGLDIGTTKICALIGEMTDQGVEIIGVGSHPSQGLRKGVVINIEATVSSVRRAIEEAGLMAGCEVHTVFTSISGGHVKAFNSHGIVAVKNKEVTQRDLERVIDAAKAVAIPMDREVLHVLPQDYIVDDQDGIKDPLGMSGVRLEAKVHIVTGAVTSAQNIIKCCNRTGLNVAEVVLAPLAAADAVLTDEQRELGVVLVDMGGGTTDIVIYHEGTLKHTAVLGIGGNHVTNDIAAGLRTPFNDAERIKQRYGYATAAMVSDAERVDVPSVAGKGAGTISRQILCEIIEPRLDEIFELVQKEIVKSGLDGVLASGIVVTGGSMLLPGAVEMAERCLGLPVRLGVPVHVVGLVDIIDNPVYAAGVGLVLHGMKRQERSTFRVRDDKILSKVKHRMSDWLSEFF
ncbi:MAG: cell division protein FtsA [Deltaproteobacteria bacterium]|jgi:cell division protein FtsA|nr:MAG: cell division protein FtsA [Deltaproteobacteria bacterium]